MNTTSALSKERILEILETVKDPEIPVISVVELGVVRGVEVRNDGVTISVTPTYTGCPAMDVMRTDITKALNDAGIDKVEVKNVLSPAWTTDWMNDVTKEKLRAYGIAPPSTTADKRALLGEDPEVKCPQCRSADTAMISAFGSTACKSLYKCNACLEPFDHFKCI